jgi:hypothetical protein
VGVGLDVIHRALQIGDVVHLCRHV